MTTADDETIRAATRALTEATAVLSDLLARRTAPAPSKRPNPPPKTKSPTAPTKSSKVDQTRAELLAAAGRVFAEKGYEGASVGDIAAAAGYTKGALYAHFTSKTELFLAFARQKLHHDMTAESAEDVSCLADAMRDNADHHVDDETMLRGLEIMTYAVRHPESHAELAPQLADSVHWLARKVRDDRDPAGKANPPTESDYDTAIGIISITNFTVLLRSVTGPETIPPGAGGRLIERLMGS